MKVAILGAGALGLLWGARLAELPYELTFITRTIEQKEKLNEQGLTITTLSKQTKKFQVIATWMGEQDLPIFDLILVTVKQLHLPQVIPLLQRCSHEKTLLLFFQNGMGHESSIIQLQQRTRTYAVVTTEGALRKSSTEVCHTGKGEAWIGSFPYEEGKSYTFIQPFLQVFQQEGTSDFIQYDSKVKQRMWEKLAINSVINPLTTFYRVKNGELISGKYDEMMKAIFAEAIGVINQMGFQLDEETMFQRVLEVCRRTAQNQSSMLQDLLKGNRTEIDHINGIIVSLGKKLHIPTPVNEQMVQQIHRLEYEVQSKRV
ncbi:ketopantoate reductase family protein [Hazenella coriacea]|uniref:ketopantoate reductase family protein n=1 Tax=Hazenella coriacea TaxID=1179467 RepID=UPI0014055CEA|nr:2-dehydropantoate 2-reductase [Hazenella coriacea]